MSHQPEMRFMCNRCNVDVSVSLNDMPAQNRAKPPEGWVTFWVDETTGPALHLCLTCAPKFSEFMRNPS